MRSFTLHVGPTTKAAMEFSRLRMLLQGPCAIGTIGKRDWRSLLRLLLPSQYAVQASHSYTASLVQGPFRAPLASWPQSCQK